VSDEETEGQYDAKESRQSSEERERKWREEDERFARTEEAIQALLKKVQGRHKGEEDDDDGVGVGVLI
jgi:hypothetical protein